MRFSRSIAYKAAQPPSSSHAFSRKARGFTLMELLVVVAILAVVGGMVVVAYDGLVGQSAKGVATHTISSLGSAIRNYQVMERNLPNNLDSLIAVEVAKNGVDGIRFDPNVLDNVARSYGTATAPKLTAALNEKLAGRIVPHQLTTLQRAALISAGIRTIRYLDLKGENLTADSTTLDLAAANSTDIDTVPAVVGPLGLIDIPQQLFDTPEPVSLTKPTPNRGRGFAYTLNTNQLPYVARWLPNPAIPEAYEGYENVRLGAHPKSVLVVFGVGRNSSLVTATAGAVSTKARLDSTPIYGDVRKNEYPNYLIVVDVSESPARFVTVIDPTGGSLAENYAGGRGQQ